MAIFTAEELQAHIAAAKAALLANPRASEYTMDVGGSRRTIKRHSPEDLRKHLEWLQGQLDAVSGTSVGRTFAKQGGGGRW